MPFVPLHARKRLEVVLDDDKARMAEEQRVKDEANMAKWRGGILDSQKGYRFAMQAGTQEAQYDRPFEGLPSSWRPPSPNGSSPAGRRERSHGKSGVCWEGAHGLKKSSSTPAVQRLAQDDAVQAAHPLSVELRRWERLASTQERELKDVPPPEGTPWKVAPAPSKEPMFPKGGLVNFPRYMLINDCTLKRSECQRFLAQQKKLAEEQAARQVAGTQADSTTSTELGRTDPSRQKRMGHLLPSGRGSRTSNPFRFG
mmetsp:Transcript_3052/g.7816  ORF Transcript_3052/g.7816 Transcript_3052/m.7816 type:complete len:256 (+) Transcript_3052:110-877(+)